LGGESAAPLGGKLLQGKYKAIGRKNRFIVEIEKGEVKGTTSGGKMKHNYGKLPSEGNISKTKLLRGPLGEAWHRSHRKKNNGGGKTLARHLLGTGRASYNSKTKVWGV